MKIFVRLLVAAMLFATVGLVGCSDDGSDGAAGASAYEIAVANGFTGTEAEWLAMISGEGIPTTADLETCGVCHQSVENIHAVTDVSAVSNVASSIEVATGDLLITFDVRLDGALNNDFALRRAYLNWDNPAQLPLPQAVVITTFQRDTITDSTTVTNDGLGHYTARVPAAALQADSTVLVQLESNLGTSAERPVVVVDDVNDTNGTSHLRDLVTDAACAKCHGEFPAWSEKFRHYAVGGSDCQICHSRATRTTGYITRDTAGALVTQDRIDTTVPADGILDADPIAGTNLAEYIHGIHNSHNLLEDTYYRTTAPDGAANIEDRYSIGFPSDMRNCSVCHEDDGVVDRNEIAAAAPVSYYLCFSCHGSWDNFTPALEAGGPLAFHRAYVPDTDCMAAGCHGAATARNEAADFHDSFALDSHVDSFFRGEDVSFTNPDQVSFAIASVTADGSNVSFTWTATEGGVAVDPCNADLTVSPSYQELGAYLAYAKGDDWVNEFVGSSPGQPNRARNLFTSLTTTCTDNVATTTGLVMDPEAVVYADKVLLALGGKASDRLNANDQDYFVRESSPTFAFDPATGAAATPRRSAVDNDKCLGCHQGTLYQHGGDRVDNEQLCVVCHNPSSGDKNNRLELFAITNADGSVNTDATYDGKDNETYDMRVMIHAIHGVGKRVPGTAASDPKPWTIYRSRGIYSFVPALFEEVAFDPLNAPDDFDTVEIPYPFPAGWPADGETINGSTNGSTIAHNWVVVHYPRRSNECMACHNAEAFEAPDQSLAVPLTVDPVGPDYADQSDDIVIGPGAAACTACHANAITRIHATEDFGYKANVLKEDMLDKAAQ